MIKKDPDSTRTYFLDWTEWLGADTLSTVVWTVPAALTLVSQSNTSTRAYILLSGGINREVYNVGCRITTAGGQVEDDTLVIYMEER